MATRQLKTYYASSKRSVTKSMPLRAMNVSLPQHLMKPVEKWGRPAAREAHGSSSEFGGGRWAEQHTLYNCTEPKASLFTNEEPSATNLQRTLATNANASLVNNTCTTNASSILMQVTSNHWTLTFPSWRQQTG